MKRPILPIVLLVLVVLVIMVLLATCAPQQPTSTPAGIELTEPPVEATPTDTPTDIIPTNTLTQVIPSETPTDTPEPTAEETGNPVEDFEPAIDLSIIYALSDGAAYVLTPRRTSPGVKAEELAGDPSALENMILGRLTVVRPLIGELPRGIYTITLDPTGETVVFAGEAGVRNFPAVIRSLPLPIPEPRPVAMISSVQMCIAWDTLQICALISTTLPDDLRQLLESGIQELGANPNSFALDRAVPDLEGDNIVKPCLDELTKQQPDYTKCPASVLAAPAVEALEPPPLPPVANGAGVLAAPVQQAEPEVNSTAVLVVLTKLDLAEDAYTDHMLTPVSRVGEVQPGNYLMYDIILSSDQVIDTYDNQQITDSRVGLSTQVGEEPQLYLHAVIGAPLVGDPITGGPPEGDEAVISSLWIKRNGKWSCYLRECPYYRR